MCNSIRFTIIVATDFRLFIDIGVGSAFRAAKKAIKILEIRRVTGAGCFYTQLHLLVQHEAEVGNTVGTDAVTVLSRHMAFALAFCSALHDAVKEGKKFNVSYRLQTYKV